jgi:replicative DNA helicase
MTPLTKQQADTAQRYAERERLEQALVGALIAFSVGSKPYLAGDALSLCPPACFVSPARQAAEAIRECLAANLPVDMVTVTDALVRAKSTLHPATVFEWASGSLELISENSVLSAAETVAREWRKDRAAPKIADALQSMHTFAAPLDIVLDDLRTAAETLDGAGIDRGESLDDLLDAYSRELIETKTVKPIRAPWETLTRILRGGILPGELCILAARPSVGKSAMALNWALSVACAGLGVVFVSLEMGWRQLMDRLAANIGAIDLGSFREGQTEMQRQDALSAVHALRGKRLDIVDAAKVTTGEVRRRVRIAQRKGPVGLVVVDYLQLVTPDDAKIPREQQVAVMSRAFKLMARDLGVPVLLLAQLSRKGEEGNREPILSDLRESGAIEQDADIVVFLHQARKRVYDPDEPVKVIVAKGRSSGVGRTHFNFLRRIQRFDEGTEDDFSRAQAEDTRAPWEVGEQCALV